MRWSTFALLGIFSCSSAAKEQPYRPPRLDNGQPDLQGVWIASNSTPLQRPAGYPPRLVDEAQAAQLLAAMEARAEDRTTPTEPTEYFEDLRIEPIRGELRSSVIVDPPKGSSPATISTKREIAKAVGGVLTAMDAAEQRPTPERCLSSQTIAPPILSIRNGVNLHQIVQTRDAFLFLSEFVHAARIVRLELTTFAGGDHVLAGGFDRTLEGRRRSSWRPAAFTPGRSSASRSFRQFPGVAANGRDRALRPRGGRPDRLHVHGRRPDLLHAALDRRVALPAS